MSNKLWFKGGKLLTDQNGRPYLCGKCPCGKDTYYVGYFCPCGDKRPSGDVGPASVGIYALSWLVLNGYYRNTWLCQNDRKFTWERRHVSRDYLERLLTESGYTWTDSKGEKQEGTALQYYKFLAEACVETCASWVHYRDGTSSAGEYFNACKINYDGSVYDLHMTESRGYNGTSISIFKNTPEGGEPKITVTFNLGAATYASSMWLEDGKTKVWRNIFYVAVSVDDGETVESGKYYSQNITDGPLSEGGAWIAGVELPFQVTDIAVDEEYLPDPPETHQEVQDPDWYVITSRYANGGDIISWTYYRGYYTEMEKPFRIYDFELIPYNSGYCNSLSLYVDEELPQEFE